MFPSDNQAALQMLALKSATKKPVKLVPKQAENINLDSRSDDELKQMSISVSRTQIRQDHSLTSVLSARSKVLFNYHSLNFVSVSVNKDM